MKWSCGLRILSVVPTEESTLITEWSDGSTRVFDPIPRLKGDFMGRLREPDYFRKVRVSELGDTIEWPEGQDFAPESLYENSLDLNVVD